MAWFNESWLYRTKVTVDATYVTADQTDFPVYVNLANLPADFHTNVKSDGGDIRVTTSDEVTECPVDIVNYTAASDTGELHFKAPSISTSVDVDFYVYYGNAAASTPAATDANGREAVWKSDFDAVWHMDSSLVDSTSNRNHLTNSGTVSANVKIGTGRQLDTNSDYLDLTNDMTLTNDFTIEFWAQKVGGTNDSGVILSHGSAANQYVFLFEGNYAQISLTGEGLAFANEKTFTTLDHYVFTKSGTTGKIYVSGALVQTVTATGSSPSLLFQRIGGYTTAQYSFMGYIDELRMQNGTVATATYIATTYNNQANPNTFYIVGAHEENAGGGGGGGSSVFKATKTQNVVNLQNLQVA